MSFIAYDYQRSDLIFYDLTFFSDWQENHKGFHVQMSQFKEHMKRSQDELRKIEEDIKTAQKKRCELN